MLPSTYFAIEGDTPIETFRLRQAAIRNEQLNPVTRAIVPKADPATTVLEVPPGVAEIRAELVT